MEGEVRENREERHNRDERPHREERHHRSRRENGNRREKIPFCYFHGKDKGHWTNECPIAIEKKEELDRQGVPAGEASQLHLAATATKAFGLSPHVDSNPKLANIIPNAQLHPTAIRTSIASPFGAPQPMQPLRNTLKRGRGAPRLNPMN